MQQLLSDCADSGKFYNAGETDKRNVALLRFSRRLVVYTTWQRAFIYFSHYVCSTWFGNKKNPAWCGTTNSAAAAAALFFLFHPSEFHASFMHQLDEPTAPAPDLEGILAAPPHIAGWCSALYSWLQSNETASIRFAQHWWTPYVVHRPCRSFLLRSLSCLSVSLPDKALSFRPGRALRHSASSEHHDDRKTFYKAWSECLTFFLTYFFFLLVHLLLVVSRPVRLPLL